MAKDIVVDFWFKLKAGGDFGSGRGELAGEEILSKAAIEQVGGVGLLVVGEKKQPSVSDEHPELVVPPGQRIPPPDVFFILLVDGVEERAEVVEVNGLGNIVVCRDTSVDLEPKGGGRGGASGLAGVRLLGMKEKKGKAGH